MNIHLINSPNKGKQLARGSVRSECRGDLTTEHDKKIDWSNSDLSPTLRTELHVFISSRLPSVAYGIFIEGMKTCSIFSSMEAALSIHTNSSYEISNYFFFC